ncbi:MAG TPA: hypothetical protein PLP63_06895 [Saprospiraceae bacterium]|nr:hypothetical protein [Saprospiraceae bacterium]
MITPGNISAVGQTAVWTITVTNGPTNNVGVSVNLSLDANWAFVPGDVVTQGGRAGNTWTIGAMTPGQVATGVFYIQKTIDLLSSPWNFIATVSGLDTDGSDNVLTDTVTLGVCVDCPPSGGAIDDPWSCLCGNVLDNDTACTAGITTVVEDVGSVVNCEIMYFNQSTGQYNVRVIDPTKEWSFEYTMWCDTGGGPIEVSGPATVSGPAIFSSWSIAPKLVQEDFAPEEGDTTVTLANTPLAGYPVFAYRDGDLQPLTAFSVVGNVVTFTTAFGPSEESEFTETASIVYYQ